MKQQWFELTTRSNVIVSYYGATEGTHQSLDHIPGSALIGVVSSLWDQLEEGLLLDGRLRISDALPFCGENPEVCLPMPLNFHQAKYPKASIDANCFNGLYDLQKYKRMQLKQMRKGFIGPMNLVHAEIPRFVAVKTALDRSKYGSAKEDKLFTYESIPENMVYRFFVEADDSVSDREFEAVCARLKKAVRIGRSRTAEYGAVAIKAIDVSSHPAGNPVEWEHCPDCVALYFVSDYLGETANGPTIVPAAADFFLDDSASICWEKSFIRSRRYSPWNRHFHTRMQMRHVISKGSVVVFKTNKTWTLEKLNALQNNLDQGVGSFINEGLGVVRVNPKFVVSNETMTLVPVKQTDLADSGVNERIDEEKSSDASPLIQFLKHRSVSMMRAGEAKQLGLEWSKKWIKFMNALKKDNVPVPGKTQWSNLREIAVRNRGLAVAAQENLRAFLDALKSHCKLPVKEDGDTHHRSIRHSYWDTKIRSKTRSGEFGSVSLYDRIVEDLQNPDIKKRERRTPGLTVDAFIQAVVEVTRTLDKKN